MKKKFLFYNFALLLFIILVCSASWAQAEHKTVLVLHSWIWLVMTAFVILSVLVAVLLINIIKRRRIENALRISEKRFRTVIEHAADAIFVCNDKGYFVDVNIRACESLGYTRDELIGTHFTTVDVNFANQEEIEAFLSLIQPGQPAAIESNHRRKDGSIFPIHLRIGLFKIDNERFLVALASDTTRQKKMEIDLRESEARYRQLVQYAPAGIYEADLVNMRFTSVNDVLCDYIGYTREELLKMEPYAMMTEESLVDFARHIEALTPDNPTPDPAEFRVRAKDGHEILVLINARFSFENGQPVRATGVVHDITTLRQTEEEKKELEAKLLQIQKMESLGTLAGGIAHDFNNLLMGILGNASLMQLDNGRNRDDTERLDNIETYVKRGMDLTRQLLGLARGGKYEVKPTDLNLLIHDNAEMFGRTKKEIHIHYHFQESIWAVECDQGQIDQVLLNIFVNAWQAMPNGGDLIITTENVFLDETQVQHHEISQGQYVCFAIQDSGIGMEQETIAKIFDPFFTTKARERGTGLGLASAYGIIRNHGGFIDVHSQPGQGSTFKIYLPAVDKPIEHETSSEGRIVYGEERILLVDDEAMVRDVGQKMLEKLGYRVITAESGGQALEIYQEQPQSIDMVVLDMIMPDMSGAETFSNLRQIDSQVRVLLSSGYSIDGQATKILAQGCRGFIQKPFNVKELSEKVRDVLEGQAS